MRYLYNKFPEANSGQLSWARSRSVCAPALASVAVNHLGLHKMLLVNNVELSIAIGKYIPILESTSSEEIIRNGWKHDPPKAISDVLESVLGAVFVDMNFDFEKAAVIVESVLQDLLVVLSPDMPRDPVSELMVWSAKAGCRKITFRYLTFGARAFSESLIATIQEIPESFGIEEERQCFDYCPRLCCRWSYSCLEYVACEGTCFRACKASACRSARPISTRCYM